MREIAIALIVIGGLWGSGFAHDVNLNGVIDSSDLFALSSSWGVFFTEERVHNLLTDWQSRITYQPARENVTLELAPEGNEPQIYIDAKGIAYTIYVKRTPELAPDNSTVMTPQLMLSSILPSGDYWQREVMLTKRTPNILLFGDYYAPALAELVLVGPQNRLGDFYAIWPHPTAGFSMIRFNPDGIPITREYQTQSTGMGRIERPNAALDDDGNIHIVWTECPFCFADPEIRGTTREIRYSKFTPRGQMLLDSPITLGQRPTSSGNAESFRPVIRAIGGSNMLVLMDQGESNPMVAVKVSGADGAILDRVTLTRNFVEPDFIEMDNGDIAMVAMIFVVGKGRDVFYTVLNPNLTQKVAPVNLSGTIQQSDGAGIAVIGNGFYVAWNEGSDNYMRLVRLNANGSRQGSVVKFSGPGIGFPYRLRLASDPSGMAHIVYADGKGSILVKVSYEKRRIR